MLWYALLNVIMLALLAARSCSVSAAVKLGEAGALDFVAVVVVVVAVADGLRDGRRGGTGAGGRGGASDEKEEVEDPNPSPGIA